MRKTCLQSVVWLLHLGYADWDHAVWVQYHLSTSNYCHQQEKAEQEEEEESKAKVHIHVEPAWGWIRRVHFDQSHKISLLPSCWSPLCSIKGLIPKFSLKSWAFNKCPLVLDDSVKLSSVFIWTQQWVSSASCPPFSPFEPTAPILKKKKMDLWTNRAPFGTYVRHQ